MNVAFINENTLGHASYLGPFVNWLQRHPEAGVTPHVINATPLPEPFHTKANFSVRGLRKTGLDFHLARWRFTVSRYVNEQLAALRQRQKIDAIVVNTQSVALELIAAAKELPVLVCLDATFEQLSQSRWFAPNALSRCFLPLTVSGLKHAERNLFQASTHLLPWSEPVKESLLKDYQIPAQKISVLPPSLALSPLSPKAQKSGPAQILFVGGDFSRKGGPLLLECFQQRFAGQAELHLVTHSQVPNSPGVFVHHGLTANSPAWRERWEQADLFVFPSTLETFGIVLLEAQSFGLPVIATEAGAAREILDNGQAGWLLREGTAEALANSMAEALSNPALAQQKARAGRQRVEQHFNLDTNTEKLAKWLRDLAKN